MTSIDFDRIAEAVSPEQLARSIGAKQNGRGGFHCPSKAHEHWNNESIAPRIARVMLGYDPDLHESYRDYQWENKLHIAKTLQRHFINWNPDNPFQPDDPDYYAPRPVHSPQP